MAEDGLKLQVGDNIQVQLFSDPDDNRYLVKVIGFVPGQSLIVHTPRTRGNSLLLREGQLLTLRVLSGNTVYAFETNVLRSCMQPYPYLHLAYPREFEHMVVRKAPRARVNVIASVVNYGSDARDKLPAVLIDLSVSGGMIRAGQPCGEIGDNITVAAKIKVVNIEKYITIPAVIRRVRVLDNPEKPGQPEYHYGLEFQFLEPDDQLVLHGLVFEQIVQGNVG